MVRRDLLKASIAASLTGGASVGETNAHEDWSHFHRARRWVTTRAGRIALVENGEGPAALFLHGWPLNGFHWRASMQRLSNIRRCIAPDFLGLGYSETPENADLSPMAQASMIIQLMDALAIPNADIVANDSGTAIAQMIAALYPERVRSLLLTNGDVHTNSPPDALAPALEAARAGALDAMIEQHLATPGFAASPQGLGGICYADPRNLTQEAMETYFRPLLASPQRRAQFQAYGVAFTPNHLPSLESRLRLCQAPARMVWGDGDIHFAPRWAHWLARTLPNSREVRIVAGAKLFFPEELPDLIAEEAQALWSAAN